MEKVNVNGPETHPVYLALKKATKSEKMDVKWNFETKFLISRDAKSIVRFSKAMEPNALVPFIDLLVGKTLLKASL
jgi:glutathione peroxidase